MAQTLGAGQSFISPNTVILCYDSKRFFPYKYFLKRLMGIELEYGAYLRCEIIRQNVPEFILCRVRYSVGIYKGFMLLGLYNLQAIN